MSSVYPETILISSPDGSSVGSHINDAYLSSVSLIPITGVPVTPYPTSTLWANSTTGQLYYGNFNLQGGVYGPGPTTVGSIPVWGDIDGTSLTTTNFTVAGDVLSGPTGITETPVVANPGGANTLWINSGSGRLFRGTVDLEQWVTGVAATTVNALARWADTTASSVKTSIATLTNSGLMAGLTGITFTAQGANPGGANTLWVNSGSGDIYVGGVNQHTDLTTVNNDIATLQTDLGTLTTNYNAFTALFTQTTFSLTFLENGVAGPNDLTLTLGAVKCMNMVQITMPRYIGPMNSVNHWTSSTGVPLAYLPATDATQTFNAARSATYADLESDISSTMFVAAITGIVDMYRDCQAGGVWNGTDGWHSISITYSTVV